MKILQINSVCGYGSTGRIAADLYHAAKADGMECRIAYGRGEAPADIETIRIGAPFHVRLHGALSRLTDKHGFYSRQATRDFIARVKEWGPDLIHLHNIHGYYLNLPILFEYLGFAGLPVVWTLHDCWTFTGHCAYFDAAGCEKWRTGCGNCPQLHEYPASFGADRSAWNYQRKRELFSMPEKMVLVTPSEWLADLARESFLGGSPVRVIPNGIDLEKFRPTPGDFRERYGLVGKKLALGVASVWERRKGLDDFIRLSGMLGETWKIVLVGLSEQQMKELPPGILGLARTGSIEELAALYTAADVFVNPTQEDNFPTTNLEALACGTPVLTYRTGGSPESISASCGIVVEKGDIKALAQAVQEADFSAEACLERAKCFDKTAKYLDYIRLYRDMTGEETD